MLEAESSNPERREILELRVHLNLEYTLIKKTYENDSIDVEGLHFTDAVQEFLGQDPHQLVHHTRHNKCRHSINLCVYHHKIHEYLPDVTADLGGVFCVFPIKVSHLHPVFDDALQGVTLPLDVGFKYLVVQSSHIVYHSLQIEKRTTKERVTNATTE